MAKQYYIKKNPGLYSPNVEWGAINGKKFYQLITSLAGRDRYFIDMYALVLRRRNDSK